ncbi:MAG: beta-lactamase family protein, partial [Lysobacter sp.]|nr:beta-lactamase family protein [Lysobacter sp.]
MNHTLPTNPSSSSLADLGARVDDVLDRATRSGRLVGAVVLVARAGRVVYRRAAGWADRESRRALAPDAIVLLSSVTKPIVSLAAMRLVESGRLDLDAPVTRWLPGFRPRLPGGLAPAITIRHLLTHTAGLVYPGNAELGGAAREAGVSSGLDGLFTTLDENLRRIAGVPLASEPGARWIYSLSIDVLGAVIEASTARPLGEALRELVLDPLGMVDTGFTVAARERLVTHYADARNGPVVMPARHRAIHEGGFFDFAPGRIDEPSAYPSAGAGLAGTAGDVLRALEALRIGHAGVLSAAGAQCMRRAHVGAEAQSQGPGWGFGLGGAVLVDPVAAETPQSAGTMQWGGV